MPQVEAAFKFLHQPHHWDSELGVSGKRTSGRGTLDAAEENLDINPRHTAAVQLIGMKWAIAMVKNPFPKWVNDGLQNLVDFADKNFKSFETKQNSNFWGASYFLECLTVANENQYLAECEIRLSTSAFDLFLKTFVSVIERLKLFL